MRIGFLIFPEVQDLDLFGPWDLAFAWHTFAEGPEPIMLAESLAPIRTSCGATVTPRFDLSTCPDLDYLLVPGGSGTRALANNARVLQFVRERAAACKALLSVCTGSAYVLEPAGLLEGKTATTFWGALDHLRSCKGVKVEERRYVQDGNLWTSAGVSAGMDMMLAFIAQTAGTESAAKVQIATEYFPEGVRYGDFVSWPEAPAYVTGD